MISRNSTCPIVKPLACLTLLVELLVRPTTSPCGEFRREVRLGSMTLSHLFDVKLLM
jgi:hypothetical protein